MISLSQQVGRILGKNVVQLEERERIIAAVDTVNTYTQLPADIRDLLDAIASRGPHWPVVERKRATRANPYHDKGTGQFTSKAGALGTGANFDGLTEKGKAAVRANLKAHGLTQEGIENELAKSLTPANLVAAKRWYPEAHKFASSLAAKHGVTVQQAAGVISAVSPRTPWPRNQVLAERVLSQFRDHPSTMGAQDVAARIGGGLKANITPAVQIARGESIDGVLTGVKRRSFYNNIAQPTRTDSVTVDTWMQRAVMRSATKEMDLDAALDFVNASKAATGGAGAGYISIAEATRAVAKKHNLAPDEVQSAYWIMTSGSAEGGRPGA